MYFAGKLVYLIVRPSNQLAVTHCNIILSTVTFSDNDIICVLFVCLMLDLI